MADRCYAANSRSVRCPPDTVPPPRPQETTQLVYQQRIPFLQPLRGGDPEDAELLRRHAEGLRYNSLIQNEGRERCEDLERVSTVCGSKR
jgi:hypothetical protein